MLEQFNTIIEQGFKPVIFVDKLLEKTDEIKHLSKKVRQCKIPIFNEDNLLYLNKLRKAYVFSYGGVPQTTRAMIYRKGGKIVSGNLIID